MEKYWKLLDIDNQSYSTHETEEEVNHIIEHTTLRMDDDKVIKRYRIPTPFPNYDFYFVSVFDMYHVHQFIYFFDIIEEECDSLREQISRRNSKIVELIDENSNLRKELKSALEFLHDQYDDYPF